MPNFKEKKYCLLSNGLIKKHTKPHGLIPEDSDEGGY